MTMQPATDPDCLAFFRTAEKDKKKKDGLPLSEQDGGTLRVVGRALDSLARLLVLRDEHQAIYAARQLFRRHHLSAFRIPVSILRDADDPALRQLMELEVTIFRYSWYAMRERFTQEDCHTALSRICDAVLASGENTNPLLLPSLKADNLRPLQGDVSRHFSVLRLLLRRIGDLLAGSPGDSAIHQLPDYLAKLSVLIAEVQIHIPRLFEMLASYEREFVLHRIRMLLTSPPRKHPRGAMRRLWALDGQGALHSLGFPTARTNNWSRTLDSHRTETVVAKRIDRTELSPQSVTVEVTVNGLRKALELDENFDDLILEDFLQSRVRLLTRTDAKEVTVDGRIHCECAVLAELDKISRAEETIIPYIGISELSCYLCYCYFEVYNEVTGEEIMIQGTHNRMLPWRCPTLDDQEDDEEVREEVSTKLRRLLGNEVRYFKWRRYEQSRQQSIASLESGESIGLAKMLAELDCERFDSFVFCRVCLAPGDFE